jgi:hypothetical protein
MGLGAVVLASGATRHLNRLADWALLAFFSTSTGLVSAILLALPAGSPLIGGTWLNKDLGYAGFTATTVPGLRVLAAVGREDC